MTKTKLFKLLFFIIFALIGIKYFLIDYYIVSSKSMESTLKINDIIFINKVAKNYKRYDIIVFKKDTYNTDIVKRIIGLPNEILEIKNSKTYIDENQVKDLPSFTFDYIFLDTVNMLNTIKTISNRNLKKAQLFKLRKMKNTKKIPNSKWTLDNFGAVWIPKKNTTILIDSSNYFIYKSILLSNKNSNLDSIHVINKPYTFKQNYYFVLGDNRHHSRDSRYFGFLPEKNIVGKFISKLP